MSLPLYSIGDVVYLRESASIGALESVRISGVCASGSNWLYQVNAAPNNLMAATTYGDRISHVTNNAVYYQSSEFCVLCDALNIIKDVLQSRLDKIDALLALHCDTTG